ncbi:DNA-processing protein DprA [Rothia sp. ZJ1223]|uniref:DNA-processing protein DprA n=1 Tax=Rothia sp. ZJ1223 TaxID=2811098 RepID=UPI00195C8781|nr:DNA-processing protein DprA [Rothia sp. ZJ1223]MBM7050901.1 DNA-processing protein DprA [Rothia sp. ZJ1223]
MKPTPETTTNSTQRARAIIMRAVEPQDHIAHALIESQGVEKTAHILSGREKLTSHLTEELIGDTTLEPEQFFKQLTDRIERCGRKLSTYNPDHELHFAPKIGAWLCTPEDDDWPQSLNDFGYATPFALWGRGDRNRLNELKEARSLAVVGSRDISAYGRSATQHLAGELAQAGLTIVSGGAFGIDAVAHTSALATGTSQLPTVALMAGGLDSLYPKHNENLLHQVIEQGLILSEVPMGLAPTRWRFLQRNRLIAGLSRGTIIVEARWRSGALNTANHTLELGRTVYAVPGSIFSPSSEGCHRLLKDGLATVLTNAQDLIQEMTQSLPVQSSAFPEANLGDTTDTLDSTERFVWDALPVRRTMSIEELSSTTSLPARTLMVTLSKLHAHSLASQDTATLQWKKKIPARTGTA